MQVNLLAWRDSYLIRLKYYCCICCAIILLILCLLSFLTKQLLHHYERHWQLRQQRMAIKLKTYQTAQSAQTSPHYQRLLQYYIRYQKLLSHNKKLMQMLIDITQQLPRTCHLRSIHINKLQAKIAGQCQRWQEIMRYAHFCQHIATLALRLQQRHSSSSINFVLQPNNENFVSSK